MANVTLSDSLKLRSLVRFYSFKTWSNQISIGWRFALSCWVADISSSISLDIFLTTTLLMAVFYLLLNYIGRFNGFFVYSLLVGDSNFGTPEAFRTWSSVIGSGFYFLSEITPIFYLRECFLLTCFFFFFGLVSRTDFRFWLNLATKFSKWFCCSLISCSLRRCNFLSLHSLNCWMPRLVMFASTSTPTKTIKLKPM